MTEQLRALVPGWVEWLGPLLFLAGMLSMLALVPIAAVRTAVRRIDPADHWTEQARFVHAARVSVVWAAATVPAGIFLLSNITIGPVGWLPSWLFGLTGAATAVLVVARVSWWLEGSVLQQPVPEWSRFLLGFVIRLVPLGGHHRFGSGRSTAVIQLLDDSVDSAGVSCEVVATVPARRAHPFRTGRVGG